MRKFFIFSVAMFSSFALANVDSIGDLRVEDKKENPDSCYRRICKVIERNIGNGYIVEDKICGEWVKIPCSEKEEEQPREVNQ